MATKPPDPDTERLDELFSIGNLTEEQYRQVKRLRAENERLKQERSTTVDVATLVARGVVDTREAYERVYEELRQAQAANERLRVTIEITDAALVEQQKGATRLETENQRLREALEVAWEEHKAHHPYCSAFSPDLEREALTQT